MQWDYVYADLQLKVTFDAKAEGTFGKLTDFEVKALQQLIYMTLMEFQYVRVLADKDIAGLRKVMDCLYEKPDIPESGG